MTIKAVVFDIGGVLVDWNPRHLYRKLIDDEAAMEEFLATICTPAWNDELDKGKLLVDAVAERIAEHPEHAELIGAYHHRWAETVAGPIDDVVAIVDELHELGVPLYVLSNMSPEMFGLVGERFPVFDRFAGRLLSGEVGVTKPDARIYAELCARFGLDPSTTLFIDDNPPNLDAALAAGLQAVHFTSAATLRGDLVGLGILTSG